MCRHFRALFPIPSQVLLTVILLLQCIYNGAAIKCFVCDSSDNPSCGDLRSNSSIVAEECTLDKMKSIDTWLFELNKFAYFDTGGNKRPLMNCQKVVAKDPNTNKMVTARFCQLDTGDSDACSILRSKLRITSDDAYLQSGNGGKRGKQNNGAGEEEVEEEQFHCSICTSDRCNGSRRLHSNLAQLCSSVLAAAALLVVNLQQRVGAAW